MKVLAGLAAAARRRELVLPPPTAPRPPPSLAKALARPGILAELKPGSPTEGAMRDVDAALATSLVRAGVAGLSALTEPTRFGGSPELLALAVATGAPVLMKDFVVTERQLDLAEAAGASAVLLILPLLSSEHSEWASPEAALDAARARGLETLLEVYDDEEYLLASLLEPDMVGVNNRDLREDDLPVDPERAIGVLSRCGPIEGVPVLALSGARDAADVRAQVKAGAAGVLVGTTLMKAADPAAKLRELLEGLK